MQLTNTLQNYSNASDKEVLKVILDEPRIFLRESLGFVMVRGEVIVNFPKDTYTQGPIELLFEGIQRFHPWPEIMLGSPLYSTIDTKLQVIELSLVPPNSQGLMPAGLQRFPFEFPIPSSLPTSVYIKDRMEIFYQVHATLRRSSTTPRNSLQGRQNKHNLISWARSNVHKNLYRATCNMRIVRAMEHTNSHSTNVITESEPPVGTTTRTEDSRSSIDSNSSSFSLNRRNLDLYQSNLDEQHDSLAFSLVGRSLENLSQTMQCLSPFEGIRYKISIDRTVMALGGRIGLEVMIQPTINEITVKSILLKVHEKRKYTMHVPAASQFWGASGPETKKTTEKRTMVLKWAYDNSGDCSTVSSKDRYIRPSNADSQNVSEAAPSCPYKANVCEEKLDYASDYQKNEKEFIFSSTGDSFPKQPDLVNLKELNQSIHMGECFKGQFTMPIPDCSNILNPSMEYESIDIKHWIQLLVRIEYNGEIVELNLESPGQILDCRLADNDDCQTLIPPPPPYECGITRNINWKPSTFWEQREPITLVSGWGSCMPCPCEAKKLKKSQKNADTSAIISRTSKVSSSTHMPALDPPPSYSLN